MKMFKLNPVTRSIGLLLLVISLALYNSAPVVAPASGAPKQNQLSAFPNTAEAPTSPADVGTNKYTAPRLSNALNEADPTRKLKKSEFLEIIKYSAYNLTRGELEQIFNFVDQNKDDLVDHKEWAAFSALFIIPFEACDKSGDNLLTVEEYSACFDSDPKSKLIQFRRRYNEKKHALMMGVVSSRGAPLNNFSDYLFIRKALFGWQQCHSNAKFISKSHFKCALGASIPQKYYHKLSHEAIYNTGLRLASDRNLVEMDFVSYLRILYFTHTFGQLNMPGDSAFLEKSQFLKAVKEDRVPNNWDEQEIETIYDLVNNSPTMKVNKVSTIDFESWSFFFALHVSFNVYSHVRPKQLRKDEFIKFLAEDPFVSKEILVGVDTSFTKFTQAQYQEASLVLQRYRLNEKDFFFARFKQDSSASTSSLVDASTVNSNFYDMKPNNLNREVFFTTFCDGNKDFWSKTNMYRAFQLANLYVEMSGYKQETVVPFVGVASLLDKLPTIYDSVRPPINMSQRSNYAIYKALPREISLDLLTFLALENFYTKFGISNMSSTVNVEETAVKIALKDFGMENMPDTVIDIAGKGFDSLRRRVFVPLDLAKATIIAQAVATEQLRGQTAGKILKLPENKDPARQFPSGARRFMSSDRV